MNFKLLCVARLIKLASISTGVKPDTIANLACRAITPLENIRC